MLLSMNTIDYLRTFRLGGYAIFDFIASFLGMFLVAPLLSWLCKKAGIIVPKQNWIILTLPISILVHILFGTMTPLTKQFLDPNGHYIVKIIIITCCIFGALGLKRA